HPEDIYPLLKLKVAAQYAEKQIPSQPHWAFCYIMLHKICIFYLVLRALDTVEDDTSVATEVKVPILMSFHRHVYDREWHFSCGTKDYKVLMDQFHHVSTAFLELGKQYKEAIEDITMRMGAGMAKFIYKEVESIDDYDEYCHHVAGLVGLGLSKLFHASGKEDVASDSLCNSMGLFLQKTNIIRDYLEDINEVPKCRMFWPRQIWSKYVDKLEDLKYEENSVKAVQCLNEMVTNALSHIEDCLTFLSTLRDPAIFRFCAIPQVMAIGTLAKCYNNIEVFRGVVKMRRASLSFNFVAIFSLPSYWQLLRFLGSSFLGLTTQVIDRTRNMADVYGAFFDFSCILKSKVEFKDPHVAKTLKRLEVILRTCKNSGTLNKRYVTYPSIFPKFYEYQLMHLPMITRKSFVIKSGPNYNSTFVVVLVVLVAILLGYQSGNRI
uniref:Squalene synthase n=1 Tax=Solanum lycopersicum TaxID=4081 RepID=A0A3Q7IH35_SOLLC